VDETFAEYCDRASILSRKLPASTVVLRSCTKFYGMPGLRLGYAVARPSTIDRMGKYQPPWSVNMLAQRAGVASVRDARHARLSLRFMDRERTRLVKGLERLSGCSVFPPAANFILMELPVGKKAETVVAVLRRQGLLIRDCSRVLGLNDRSMRVAVRTKADNDRLLEALSRAIGRGGA
jgi:threonine-phosphate decarboxylase